MEEMFPVVKPVFSIMEVKENGNLLKIDIKIVVYRVYFIPYFGIQQPNQNLMVLVIVVMLVFILAVESEERIVQLAFTILQVVVVSLIIRMIHYQNEIIY